MAKTGWQRLWIVLSLLLGLPAAAIAWDSYGKSYASVDYSIDGLGADAFWRAAMAEPKLKNCVQETMSAQYYSYSKTTSISCKNHPPIDQAVLWFLVPGGIMWIIGVTIGWIVSGFRQPKRV